MLDLTERVEQQQQRAARQADLDGRDREHGGLTPHDRADEEKRRSVQGWGPYKLETSRRDLVQARTNIDPRRVAIGRLWSDCGLAVRRFAKRYRRDAADTLRGDALLLLLRWERHGGGIDPKTRELTPTLDLGGSGGTPWRRDWLMSVDRADGRRETQLTRPAWRALKAAVKQAAESPSFLTLDPPEHEISTDPLDIAAAVETQQRETGQATRLPDAIAAETVSELLDVTLDAGRAIVAKAYPHASIRELSQQWGISEQSAKNAITRGKSAILARYPDPVELLDALDAAAGRFRTQLESAAILRLIDYRDGYSDESAAADAVRDWRGAYDGMPLAQRAILAAARRAEQRNGRSYGGDAAELIVRYVTLIMRAEQQRARRDASIMARGSRPNVCESYPSLAVPNNGSVPSRAPIRIWKGPEDRDLRPPAPTKRTQRVRVRDRYVAVAGCADCFHRRPHSSHPVQPLSDAS